MHACNPSTFEAGAGGLQDIYQGCLKREERKANRSIVASGASMRCLCEELAQCLDSEANNLEHF